MASLEASLVRVSGSAAESQGLTFQGNGRQESLWKHARELELTMRRLWESSAEYKEEGG